MKLFRYCFGLNIFFCRYRRNIENIFIWYLRKKLFFFLCFVGKEFKIKMIEIIIFLGIKNLLEFEY